MTTLVDGHESDTESEQRSGSGGVSTRLEALGKIVELGQGRIPESLRGEARGVLDRAGERLHIPGEHTVIALGGATGSGKSSLFNALAGIELSPVGVRRPTTGAAHACVWGLEGSRRLLEWLNIEKRHRYARTSALDGDPGGESLHGLVLLDLPDHDSTQQQHQEEVDRLVTAADLIVWVVDPQKYADAAIHERYLRPSTDYQTVTAVVLNQVDVLSSEEAEECLADLREVLNSAGLTGVQVLSTSAQTGAGTGQLRALIDDTLTKRRATTDRLVADLNRLVGEIGPYAGDESVEIDSDRRAAIITRLDEATGASAAAEAAQREHWHRGMRSISWPFSRVVRNLRGDPLRRVQLDQDAQEQLRSAPDGGTSAQPVMVYNTLRDVAATLTAQPPQPWLKAIRHAGRARAEEAPDVLGKELSSVRQEVADRAAPAWWRVTVVVQRVLALCALLSVAWIACLIVFGYVLNGSVVPPLLEGTANVPYAVLVSVGSLGGGFVIDYVGRSALTREAVARRHEVEAMLGERVDAIAEELVFAPVQQELDRYARFREQLDVLAGDAS